MQSCKGLEFDVVICADIDRHYIRGDDLEAAKKQFYVMVARARDRVIMLMRQGAASRVGAILPTDESVLIRKAL